MPERRVLIVEDEEGIALFLQFQLKRLGYEPVGPVSTGEEAVERVGELRPDLVLMDIYLAGRMTGVEASALIQERHHLPVIFLSALPGKDIMREAQETGPYAFLVKPVQEQELRAAIELAFYKHKMESRLRESEDRYRSLFVTIASGFVLCKTLFDDEGVVVDYELIDVNPAFESLTTQPASALIGQRLSKVLHWTDISAYLESYSQLTQPGMSMRFDLFQPFEQRYFELTAFSPRTGEVAVIVDEVTEQRVAQETIQESENRFRQLAATVNEVFWLRSRRDGKILYVSPAFEHVWGRPCSDFQNNPNLFYESILPEDLPRVIKGLNYLEEYGSPFNEEYRIVRPTGKVRWLRASIYPVTDGDGEVVRYSGIAEDITERKHAEQEMMESYRRTEHALRRMTVLRNIDMAITTHTDLQAMIATVLEHLTTLNEVDAALLFYPETQDADAGLRLAGLAGVTHEMFSPLGLVAMKQEAERVFKAGKTYYAQNIGGGGKANNLKAITQLGYQSCVFFPLITKGQVKGVLLLMRRHPDGMDADLESFFQSLAMQSAIAIDNVELFQNLKKSNADLSQAYDATIQGWAQTLELRDKETLGHSERVVNLAVTLARSLGMGEEEIVHFRRGVLLHDIGKLAVPDSILLKPDTLTPEEWVVMRSHTTKAYEMLEGIEFLRPAIDVPFCHHEHWNGSGYPRGLVGEEIPWQARIFAIVDAWDALINDRPYRPAWSQTAALDYIQELTGKQFDPQVVEAFTGILCAVA